MSKRSNRIAFLEILFSFVSLVLITGFFNLFSLAQSLGSAGTVIGTVTDVSGGVVVGATAAIENAVTGYRRTATTNDAGEFRFNGVPFNPYHLTVSAPGLEEGHQDITVRTSVPINLTFSLKVAGPQTTTITVESEAAPVEITPTAHTDVDSSLLAKLPIADPASSGLADAISLAAPGVVGDSNGFFHPLGEHADTTISLDNQPVSDQQSKIYSNPIPLEAIQSFEIISGAPPAEYGDKSSLVVNAITHSGLGQAKAFGSFTGHYGSFGSSGGDLTFGLGNTRVGNFLSLGVLDSGRFLDTPEFRPIHARGNSEKFFDRADFQIGQSDILHLNIYGARSWFQIPNQFDQQQSGQDQRQVIYTFNVAPGLNHTFSPTTLLTVNAFVRQDQVKYFPSRNPLQDTPATISQQRRLTNAGGKTDISYVRGRNNFKAGVQFMHTFVTENFSFGITDPTFINPDQTPGLIPFDLTRGGSLFSFRGHTDVKEEAIYAQDTITLGHFTLSPGLRYDRYDGLSHGELVQPRIATAYHIEPTRTVLRLAYSRLFETPYNENLVLSSSTGAGGLASSAFGAFGNIPLRPGKRNQFNAGLQQPVGSRVVLDGDYFWKYTNTDFDFNNLFNTPITFPIEWRKSKIDGVSVRGNIANFHGFSAFVVAGHVRSRFFGPAVGGLIFNSPISARAFRIDHDQEFQQTTNLRYQYGNQGPWVSFTYRYESGLVTSAVSSPDDALRLTANQQAQMGLFCGNTFATITQPIRACTDPNFGATRLWIPAMGTGNEDTNPTRVASRHLIDVGVGIDNLFRTERARVTLRLTALNLTNQIRLYNFLSTFSGTHFVTPRSYQAQLGLVF